MSDQEPELPDDERPASEMNPALLAIIPNDETQDLAFRSIRAIDPDAIEPSGRVSMTPERATPKGIRPMIWIRLNETRSAVVYEVILHTGQCIQVHVPYESWRLATCDSESVRAAIQKAYLSFLYQRPNPVVVKPGMTSLKILSKNEPKPRGFHRPYWRTEHALNSSSQVAFTSPLAPSTSDPSSVPSFGTTYYTETTYYTALSIIPPVPTVPEEHVE